MNLNISSRHVDITPAIRDYVTSKLERIARHFDHIIDVGVILSVDKLTQKVEVKAHVRGRDIFVEAVQEDLYAAIDSLVDKLDRSILKYKEKHNGRQHGDSIRHMPDR